MKNKFNEKVFLRVIYLIFLLLLFNIFLGKFSTNYFFFNDFFSRNPFITNEFINFIDKCRMKNRINKNDFFVGEKFKEPKISIIIPIFNREIYLENLICSLENQSLKNLEIIFIDDYSTDNSTKKIEYYMKNDKRISLIKNTRNKGVFHSRYVATLFSIGEYIYFLDPDDLLFDILGEAYKLGDKYNLDIVEFLYSKYINGLYYVGHEKVGRDYIRTNEDVKYYMFLNSKKDKDNIYHFSHGLLWEKIVKKEIVLKAYSEIGESYLKYHLITWDDSLLSFFIFRNAKSHKYLKKCGYCWNVGTTGSIDAVNKAMNQAKIVNKRFHDIFIYLKIIYEKTEDTEIDRKCILKIWDILYNEFNHKIKYLTEGFELINKVFKYYLRIKYLSNIKRKIMYNYYKEFIDVRNKYDSNMY